ncbi:GNAT family N-acetyltransferase [Nocardia salmonicida]|uniref:GNAT family N-acetyltransferase n=1 Tax=Nocardia salmonicida TaxID=53431 RepID=UPI0034002A57
MTKLQERDLVEFRRAEPGQLGEVLEVLDEAARWLTSQGVRQWPTRFDPGWVEPALSRGETWLVAVAGKLAATVTLDWSDPLWADDTDCAGYVHRMAVRRRAAGIGGQILGWAADTTRDNGRGLLRLDCVATNGRLRAHYERAGFVHRGDVQVGGAPGQRLKDGPLTVVSRYELSLWE